MQTLDVISVNLWQILISLANLYLLFLVVKRFLFKPVKKVLEQRQSELDDRYAAAENAEKEANKNKEAWEEKLSRADSEAAAILQSATDNARSRGEQLISEAKERADGMIVAAQNEAALERQKAVDGIKREIVSVSEALTEKMLMREINTDDHRSLIDSFIENIGDNHD